MSNSIKKNERMIGLDVLRILSMALITFRHFVGYADLTASTAALSFNGLLVRLLDILCGCSVNVFVLISGYFLIGSSFKRERVIKIWAETFFYSVGCFAVSTLCGFETVTSGKLMLSFLPFITRHYWFTVAYLALYIVSPLLNKLLNILTEKEYTRLVLWGAVLLSAWTTFVYFSAGVLTGGNTGLLWFMYLYAVGGYIRLYRHRVPGTGYSCILAAGVVFVLMLHSLLKDKIAVLGNFDLSASDSVFELILSVCLFVAFLGLQGGNSIKVRKLIGIVSGSSFGVYLLQESCMIRQWLWNELVQAGLYADK